MLVWRTCRWMPYTAPCWTLAFLILVPDVATAALVQWRFEGVVTTMIGTATFGVGDSWSVSLLVNPNQPNGCGDTVVGDGGFYRHTGARVRVGQEEFRSDVGVIEVSQGGSCLEPRYPAVIIRIFELLDATGTYGTGDQISLVLGNAGTGLPSTLELLSFPEAFTLCCGGGLTFPDNQVVPERRVYGAMTSLTMRVVPEPSLTILLLLGACTVARRRMVGRRPGSFTRKACTRTAALRSHDATTPSAPS